ncbi:hypothetical protein [Massilia sp. PWRC2]|uniref:hypothetical protein n=1 Tax=Massilia sp. PWRC2 TaxID=2804626 RepID=UPI003CF41157
MPQPIAMARAGVAPRRLAALLSVLFAVLCPSAARAAPSTFGPVIGSALLCRSGLDNAYFYRWLIDNVGPSYKHEGGAYWFKVDATLWGAAVKEVMVSDDSSEVVFLAAVIDMAPDKLDEAIRVAAGPRHRAQDAARYPQRESQPGSQIVYFKEKAKIYCLKYKPLPTLP